MSDVCASPVYFLLVDDREENLIALEALLRREGLVLLRARSGPEALELLLQYEVALALLDVHMPGMDGFELAELLRGTERTRRIPIIFLTAEHADLQRRFRGYEAGAVDFLQKPIEPSILKSKAEVFFQLDRQRQEVARQRDELKVMIEENARLLEKSRQYSQALEDADRRKDEFLATLAHELRNPLAPIMNAVQVLRFLDVPQPELRDLRDLIERQVTNMTRLVDDLLDVSRITRGKIKLQRCKVSLTDVVQGAIETSRPLINQGRHQFDVAMPPESPAVYGDPVRLTQVLANLLNNAAKYTPDGGRIALTVSADSSWVTIAVRDNGLGIPPEMLGNVFQMFAQVNQHLGRAQGGLGIGLTLVKRLVEMHHGTVDVKSDGAGHGSEFTVRLPIANLSSHTGDGRAEESEAGSSCRQRVLVIDDNVDAVDSLSLLLRACGHEVATAHDGMHALERVVQFKPDIVLLDLGMPGLDGYETARRLRALPEGRQVMLVALTGWGLAEDRFRTREVGFDAHLVKPATLSDLQQIIQKAEVSC